MAARSLILPSGLAEAAELPCGYRFDPTDEELVFYYLKSKLEKTLTLDVVKTLDGDPNTLYDDAPWISFHSQLTGSFDVFTKLKGLADKRRDRRTPSGTWRNQNRKPVLDSDGNILYVKKQFRFEETGKKNRSGLWLMTEFSSKYEGRKGEYVLCRIYNKDALGRKREYSVEKEEGNGKSKKMRQDNLGYAYWENENFGDPNPSLERQDNLVSAYCENENFGDPNPRLERTPEHADNDDLLFWDDILFYDQCP
ncbi:hypothetical protein JCGZ_11113 [Jatropha curcas]|uniref:NAC transcription factor 083 n=1 Tax=Jatropha curcas TaxID=180498 RepID=R4NG08_JATCU|nr:NAC transcription factor 083 [Jatropha curcas]KDP34563.1 hypothetical protein JCGZ_11113 [Jatropha curcas]